MEELTITQQAEDSINEIENAFYENLSLTKLTLAKKPHFTFFSSLLYGFILEPTNEIKTISLNSIEKKVHINPNWFNELNNEHRMTALTHEMLHYVLQHDIRLGAKNPKRFQEASDQVVNNLLNDMDFKLLPESEANLNTSYAKRSVEDVYTEILKKYDEPPEENNNGDSPYSGNSPAESNLPNPSHANGDDPLGNDLSYTQPTNQQQNQRNSDVTKANMANKLASSKEAGDMGNVLEQFFEKIADGKLDWKIVLQEHLDSITRGDKSYDRLERRYLPYELYLPSNQSENHIEKVAIAFDVSGSVSEEQIEAFLREMKNVKESCDPEVMDVITFNHNLVQELTFEQDEEIEDISMYSGGGTDLYPVFEKYSENSKKPKFLIVFSDLYCPPIENAPDYDVIWVCIDNPTAEVNFGKLIHVTSEELENGY